MNWFLFSFNFLAVKNRVIENGRNFGLNEDLKKSGVFLNDWRWRGDHKILSTQKFGTDLEVWYSELVTTSHLDMVHGGSQRH